MISDGFPLIFGKMSSTDSPFMSPWSNTFVKSGTRCSQTENMNRQDKIIILIRMNQVNAVKNEKVKHNKGCKGWWETANTIMAREISRDQGEFSNN